jgi:hypothetical protein
MHIEIKNPVTQTMLDISTVHVTRDDTILLDIQCRHNPLTAYKYAEGYFILVPRDINLNEMYKYGYSDAFVSILENCVVQEFGILRLDADGTIYDDLVKFDW